MKQRAEDNRRQFSLFYDEALDRAGVKQDSEAYSLGMSQSYIAKCTNPDSDTNLSVADVKDSKVAEAIVIRLAEDIGYTAVPGKHKLNGTTKDEKSAVLRAIAKMTEESDEKCEVLQWKIIAKQAATALKELRK